MSEKQPERNKIYRVTKRIEEFDLDPLTTLIYTGEYDFTSDAFKMMQLKDGVKHWISACFFNEDYLKPDPPISKFWPGTGIKKEEDENDGTTATWYELPPNATELKHLIWFKNMNAQVGEIFRSTYRLNDCPHSDAIRNLNKIKAYADQEIERIKKYEV